MFKENFKNALLESNSLANTCQNLPILTHAAKRSNIKGNFVVNVRYHIDGIKQFQTKLAD